MAFTFSVYYAPLIIAVVLSLVTFFYAWRFRDRAEGKALLVLAISVIWWGTGNILEYGFNDLSIKIFWMKMEYFGIESVAVAWMTFVAIYTDQRKWLKPGNLLLLSIIPVITIMMVFTNDYHGLMRYNVALDTNGPFSVITKTYGPWFWVAAAYNNCIMISGVVLIARRLTRPPRLQTKQLILLFIIALVPWVGNVLYIFKIGAWTRIDLTTTFLSISGLMMTFGLVRYQLLAVIPIAREFVMENMIDAIMIVDSLNRVVDYNSSCRKLLHLDKRIKVQPLANVLEPFQDCQNDISGNDSFCHELILNVDSGPRTYELRVDKLYNQRQKFRGRIFHFHDISDRKAADKEKEQIIIKLQEALDKVETLSGFLPICSSCKKIRDDQGYWNEVEHYISRHTKAQFSHGLCNDCMQKLYPEEYKRIKKKKL